MGIKFFDSSIPKEELLVLAKAGYGNMVKGVVDLQKRFMDREIKDLNLRGQIKNIIDGMIAL